jgi:NAD(P)-dependent dehydrogenase (short-subunit alcohol dehydrogenase family)
MTKIAIITGGSRGIGRATALLAAENGYDVCFSYASNEKAAEQTRKDCEGLGVKAVAVKGDVANEADVEALFDTCDKQLGPVSLLVNNAGIIGQASIVEELSTNTLQHVFNVNVFGAFYCAKQAVKRMSSKNGGKGGVIINISSMAATLGSPGEYVHYAASKGALETFTIGLAKEVGPQGIRVNAIQAGTASTEIHENSGNPDRPDMVAKTAPLGRVASPEDIAEAVIWLASDKASYATGASLRVSGGL